MQGVCFYLGGLLSQMHLKQLFVMTAETYTADLLTLLPWLKDNGVTGDLNRSNIQLVNAHASSHSNESTWLSTDARARLETLLVTEYRLLNTALSQSINKAEQAYCTVATDLVQPRSSSLPQISCIVSLSQRNRVL